MGATRAAAPDFMEIVAREKCGAIADEWRVYCWEVVGDYKASRDFVVGIGQVRQMTRGPNKGNHTWRDASGKMLPSTKVVVTGGEMDAARRKYETVTGNCSACGGSGDVFASWSKAEGVKTRECSRCTGDGRRPQAEG